jgi:type II secretory pathway component PulC
MRQPLWIINSALLALFFLCLYVVLLLQPKIPQATNLTPDAAIQPTGGGTPVNLKTIYEDDIFKTHISDNTNDIDVLPKLDIPNPPDYQKIIEKPDNKIVFLDPLPITITGIMTFGSEELNRAMIRDNRSEEESIYQIGDDLQDAQIIRILPHKIIIVRANSQQETLFLREQDVVADLDSIEPRWPDLINSVDEYKYQINAREFAYQVKNLGYLIDSLNLITAYKDGINTGIKIGNRATSNLVSAIGLQSGDIIVSINDIKLNNTPDRLEAYNLITSPDVHQVALKLLRNAQEIKITYDLTYHPQATNKALEAENIIEIAQHVNQSKAKLENINTLIKDQNKKNIAQFKNKISQSVSR